MKISNYFELKELTHSNTALARKIPNHPNFEQQKNLVLLAKKYLDPIREFLGRPLKLTCAFRNDEVNALVGGVKNSIHKQGKSGDMIILEKDYQKVMQWLRDEFPKGVKAIAYKDRNFIHINIEEHGIKEFLYCPSSKVYVPYQFEG